MVVGIAAGCGVLTGKCSGAAGMRAGGVRVLLAAVAVKRWPARGWFRLTVGQSGARGRAK